MSEARDDSEATPGQAPLPAEGQSATVGNGAPMGAPGNGAPETAPPGDGVSPNGTSQDGGSGDGVTRRAMLAGGGVGVAGLLVGGAIAYAARGSEATTTVTAPQSPTHTSATPAASASSSSASSPTILPMRVLSSDDAAVIGAMADRVFPADSNGPGATELGVVNYIDGQLAGPWGTGERMYRQGPFHTPVDTGHGWQYAMTPSQAYSVALDAINRHTKSAYGGKTYDQLSHAQQDAVLTDMSNDKIPTFTTLKGSDFFAMFLQNVKEGVFADPSYGGNRGVGGWELIRWPGDPMAHGDNQYKYVTDFNYYPPGPPQPMKAGGSM